MVMLKLAKPICGPNATVSHSYFRRHPRMLLALLPADVRICSVWSQPRRTFSMYQPRFYHQRAFLRRALSHGVNCRLAMYLRHSGHAKDPLSGRLRGSDLRIPSSSSSPSSSWYTGRHLSSDSATKRDADELAELVSSMSIDMIETSNKYDEIVLLDENGSIISSMTKTQAHHLARDRDLKLVKSSSNDTSRLTMDPKLKELPIYQLISKGLHFREAEKQQQGTVAHKARRELSIREVIEDKDLETMIKKVKKMVIKGHEVHINIVLKNPAGEVTSSVQKSPRSSADLICQRMEERFKGLANVEHSELSGRWKIMIAPNRNGKDSQPGLKNKEETLK